MRTISPARRPLLCVAGALLASLGCGGSSAHTADSSQGKQTLIAVLDAWKAGETPDALAGRTPAIHVSDADWKGGSKLVGYKADGEGRLVGYDMNYPVTLELKTPKGKSVKKAAVYTVTTSPQLLVLRQEG